MLQHRTLPLTPFCTLVFVFIWLHNSICTSHPSGSRYWKEGYYLLPLPPLAAYAARVSVKQLATKAIALKPIDRIQLVESILLSLDKIDPEIEALWAKEADDRLEAYKRGEIGAKDWDEIKKRFE